MSDPHRPPNVPYPSRASTYQSDQNNSPGGGTESAGYGPPSHSPGGGNAPNNPPQTQSSSGQTSSTSNFINTPGRDNSYATGQTSIDSQSGNPQSASQDVTLRGSVENQSIPDANTQPQGPNNQNPNTQGQNSQGQNNQPQMPGQNNQGPANPPPYGRKKKREWPLRKWRKAKQWFLERYS